MRMHLISFGNWVTFCEKSVTYVTGETYLNNSASVGEKGKLFDVNFFQEVCIRDIQDRCRSLEGSRKEKRRLEKG